MNYDRRLPPTPRALDDSLRSSVAARPVSSGFQTTSLRSSTTSLRSSTTSLVGHSLTGSALLPAITAPEWLEGEISIQPLSGRELVNDERRVLRLAKEMSVNMTDDVQRQLKDEQKMSRLLQRQLRTAEAEVSRLTVQVEYG